MTRIFFIVPILALLLVALIATNFVMAEPPTNVTGWAWGGEDTAGNTQPVIGWISLNCLTEQLDYCDTSDHGVHINYTTGNLSGYAWSDAFGWVDFDPQLFPDVVNTDGGRTNASSYLDPVSPKRVKGWAQVQSEVAAGSGWIQFDHNQPSPVFLDENVGNQFKGRALYNGDEGSGYIDFSDVCGLPVTVQADGTLTGCARSNVLGDIDFADRDVRLDWGSGDFQGSVDQGISDSITFDPNPFPASPNYTARLHRTPEEADWFDDTFNIPNSESFGYQYQAGDITGWVRIVAVADEGLRYGHTDWGFIKLHRTKETPSTLDYGVSIDLSGDGSLSGYAWSAGGNTPAGDYAKAGFGWLSFSPNQGGGVFNPPWLETRQGDIYSQGDIGSANTFRAPAGQFNATYLILSNGDITNFTTAGQGSLQPGSIDFTQDNVNYNLSQPTAGNRYTNLIGSLDIDGLVERDAENKNRYGTEVDFTSGDAVWSGNRLLAGKVYHVDGSEGGACALTVSANTQFLNASGAENSGAGTVVVEGNLCVQGNVDYETGTVNYLRNVPSIAWVVKGDIIISNNVDQMVGVLIALGKDGAGQGQFRSGDVNLPLEVRGMILASRFHFQRSFGLADDGTRQPSEKVIYDGRLLLNTPPGLQDIAQSLPIVRSVQ